MTCLCKSYIYQDMLEKPSELVLYRKSDQGRPGLQNIKIKALASLIITFLQTAASTRFQQSLYHKTLYRIYSREDDSLLNIDMPHYYNIHFFEVIKKVISDYNIVYPVLSCIILLIRFFPVCTFLAYTIYTLAFPIIKLYLK